MSRDLNRWKKPLAPSEQPGLDAVDSRLMAIMDLASHRQFVEAADRAAELSAEGVYDIRPISCELVAAFLESGLSVIGDILVVMVNLVGQNASAVGPTKKKEDHFDRRIAWTIETMLESIEYHEKKKTPEWETWVHALTPDLLDHATSVGDDLREMLAAGPYSTSGRTLGRLITFLRAHAEPAKLPVAAAAMTPKPPEAVIEQEEMQALRRRVELVVSLHFVELTSKLRAFEILIEKGELAKAALVADDVQTTIEAFDPRVYFPELFARFSALVSGNIGVLSTHWESRDSVGWKAMTQFYKVDLKTFVEG